VIPTGISREFVVGQDIGPFLLVCPTDSPNDWHLRQTQSFRSLDPAMTRNDPVPIIHENRHRPAPLADAGRYLIDLGVRVCTRVTWICLQSIHRHTLDLVSGPVHEPPPMSNLRMRKKG